MPDTGSPETPQRRSEEAARLGFVLTPDEAAAIENRFRARAVAIAAIRETDVSAYEPHAVFAPLPFDVGPTDV